METKTLKTGIKTLALTAALLIPGAAMAYNGYGYDHDHDRGASIGGSVQVVKTTNNGTVSVGVTLGQPAPANREVVVVNKPEPRKVVVVEQPRREVTVIHEGPRREVEVVRPEPRREVVVVRHDRGEHRGWRKHDRDEDGRRDQDRRGDTHETRIIREGAQKTVIIR